MGRLAVAWKGGQRTAHEEGLDFTVCALGARWEGRRF